MRECRVAIALVIPAGKLVSLAMQGGAASFWFLTTDHALLRKMKSESRVIVADPVDFIRTLQESNDEN